MKVNVLLDYERLRNANVAEESLSRVTLAEIGYQEGIGAALQR